MPKTESLGVSWASGQLVRRTRPLIHMDDAHSPLVNHSIADCWATSLKIKDRLITMQTMHEIEFLGLVDIR